MDLNMSRHHEKVTGALLGGMLSCPSEYALVVLDKEQKVLAWSVGAEQMFGLPVDQALGRPCFFKVATSRSVMNNIFFYRTESDTTNYSYDTEITGPNGKSIQAHISVSKCDCGGAEEGIFAIIKDTSEENHRDRLRNIIIEVAHMANQPKGLIPMLGDIMETLKRYLEIPVAYICLSHDGVSFSVSAESGLLPCGLNECCRPYDDIPVEQADGCVEACTQLMISHEAVDNHRVSKWIANRENISEPMLFVHVPLLSDVAVMGVLHLVIPERFQKLYLEESQIMSLIANKLTSSIKNKKLEEELHLYADNLEKIVQVRTDQLREKDAQLVQSGKLATLGEMATGIAHEINQPLGGISLMTQGIVKAVEKGKLTDELLLTRMKSIGEQIDRINKIINHLRIFGRQAPESKSPIETNKPMRDVFDLIGRQMANRNIAVDLELQEPLPMVLGDANRLEQVYLNILGNARDALDDQELRVEALKKQPNPPEWTSGWFKHIIVRSRESEGKVVVSITDNAGGIPDKVREKIFEPFFTTKQVGKGTGLGLSISYGIVKEFGGELLVDTHVDVGTTFTIILPAMDEGAK